eukprot:m.71347 g.71347  ORF g.71347 m.71347 type:complete len:349 (+) comp35739_c0_seq2:681-1727(+)
MHVRANCFLSTDGCSADLFRGMAIDSFSHAQPVHGVSVDPDHNCIFASASEDGRVLVWDTRMSESACTCLAWSRHSFQSVMFHPGEPRFVGTANSCTGVALYDVRQPCRCYIRYGGQLSEQKTMSVTFNQAGTELLVLRRRLPPVLYNVFEPLPACQFLHEGYLNACTMKSGCFAGDKDQYVVSGSDDFNVYIWKVPDGTANESGQWSSSAQFVLSGHRSIVNQVRFNQHMMYLISSGVEKVIKIWSPLEASWGAEAPVLRQRRQSFSTEEYIGIMLSLRDSSSHKSTAEDPNMLGFFDSLLSQNELENQSESSESSVGQNQDEPEGVATVEDMSDQSSSNDDGNEQP